MEPISILAEELEAHSAVSMPPAVQRELLKLVRELISELGLEWRIPENASADDLMTIVEELLRVKKRLLKMAGEILEARPRKTKKRTSPIVGIILAMIFATILTKSDWLGLLIRAAYPDRSFSARPRLGM